MAEAERDSSAFLSRFTALLLKAKKFEKYQNIEKKVRHVFNTSSTFYKLSVSFKEREIFKRESKQFSFRYLKKGIGK